MPDMQRRDSVQQPEQPVQSQELCKAHAPYNFVPLPENKILSALKEGENLPGHDKMEPERKTGKIRITLTACTPVFVSDGNKKTPIFSARPAGNMPSPAPRCGGWPGKICRF